MNAEKFDVEKMLEEDAESIEIDLEFKARLKANIMKNNSSFEKNNVIGFNTNTNREKVNKSKDIKFYRKYLKVASSFAIVGLIGFRVGVGNFGFVKMNNPNDIEVVSLEVYDVANNNEVALVSNTDSTTSEEKIDIVGKEVEMNSGNQGGNTEKDDNIINEGSSGNNVEVEKPKTGNDTEVVESIKDNSNYAHNETKNSDVKITNDDNINQEITKQIIGEDHNERIKNEDREHFASSSASEEKCDEDILVAYGKECNLDLYYGTLSIIEDDEFVIQDNKIYIQDKDSKELIFTQDDNYELIGIKKINDNEVLLYKGLLRNEENKIYQLSKLNISSKNETLLVVEANSVSIDNTYDKVAFEINNNIVIIDIKTEKQVKALKGKNIAWSPDGKYLSYVKIVQEQEEGEKIKTYSSLFVYNCEEDKESPLTENELIVKNDEELIGTYQYRENLWSKDNKCIYVVRENISILRDADVKQKQVIKLTYKK